MLQMRLGVVAIVVATVCSDGMGFAELQVTNTPGVPEWRSAVSTDVLVWQYDFDAIYGSDLSTGSPGAPFTVCESSGVAKPAISNNIVVWRDRRNNEGADIYAYDLSTQTEFAISTHPSWQDCPAIEGDTVVWYDNRHGGSVYGHDLATKTEFLICEAGPADSRPWGGRNGPSISGGIVVWQDDRNGNYDIYGKNLATGDEFPICTHPGWQEAPVISGNVVVWMDERNGTQDLYMYNLFTDTESPLIVSDADCRWPAIDGGIVVWRDDRYGGQADIFGYDLAQGAEFEICIELTKYQTRPSISGDWVFWRDRRSGEYDIWGAQIPEPTTLLMLVIGLAGVVARRRV